MSLSARGSSGLTVRGAPAGFRGKPDASLHVGTRSSSHIRPGRAFRIGRSAIHGDREVMSMFQRAYVAIAIVAAAGVASAADSPWQAPRTPWGAPDLQGTWTNASLTSLERDDMFKGKATLTRRGGGRVRAHQRVRAVRRGRRQADRSERARRKRAAIRAATTRSGSTRARGSPPSTASTALRSSSSRRTAKCRTRRMG